MIPEGLTFKVCWLCLNDEYPVLGYLEQLAKDDPDCFASILVTMKKLRNSKYLRMPTVRPLKGDSARGIFELRVIAGAARHYARLPLIYTSQREVILLFGETKKGEQPSPGFIRKAINYRNKVDAQEATYEEIDFTII